MSVSALFEVRPRVQACNVVLKIEDANPSMKFSVRPHSIRVSRPDSDGIEKVFTFHLPDDFPLRLQPQSLTGFAVGNEYVSFRLQTEPHGDMTGSYSAQVLFLQTEKSNCVTVSVTPRVSAGQRCRVQCGCCGHNLLSQSSVCFRRVLPLPSSLCDTNDFFCHNHSSDGGNGSHDFDTSPKTDDCFYGTGFIQLNKSALNCQQDVVIHCARCLSWLGTQDKHSATLWTCTTAVLPNESSGSCNLVSDAVGDFVDIVKEAVRESMSIACRIVLEACVSAGKSVYLLLWVLDRELLVLSARSNLDAVTSIPLVERKIAKVLFLFQNSNSQLLNSWLGDARVHTIKVGLPIITQGLDLLVKTSNLLPGVSRVGQSGFYIGYLSPDLVS